MKTGHKYLDYKSKVNIQNDVNKWEAICVILIILIFLSFLFGFKLWVIDGYRGITFCATYGLAGICSCMYGYAWRKVKNLRHQRNVAQGILLAKEFEKEEKDLEE